nr:IEV and EEV membrane glycoprotein [Wadden Sea poxvirus]
MISLNKQTINKIKRLSKPITIFMIISTIVSGIGTVLQYKEELFPSACKKGWVPYNNYCYLDTQYRGSIYNALKICNSNNAKLPKYDRINLKILSLTFTKDYWVSLRKHNKRLFDINNNETIKTNTTELIKLININDDSICFISKFGKIFKSTCEIANSVICVKKFYY